MDWNTERWVLPFFSFHWPQTLLKPSFSLDTEPLPSLLSQICRFLDFDASATQKLTTRANEFFEEQFFFTTKALLGSATEELLKQANLSVLWRYIQDLQRRTGIAPSATSALALSSAVSLNKALVDQYVSHWVGLGNPTDSVVIQQHAFDCIICAKNCLLRSKGDLTRHSNGPSHQRALEKEKKKRSEKKRVVAIEEEDEVEEVVEEPKQTKQMLLLAEKEWQKDAK